MSSYDAHFALPGAAKRMLGRWALSIVMLTASAVVAGCSDGGFRPMYASTVGGSRIDDKLARIEIATIGGKTGQRLRNELIFHSTGGGTPLPPTYRLQVTITESLGATLVKTTGESASSSYNLDAAFMLIDIQSKKVLLTGTSHGRASFDRFQSIYSNVRAADDAANRAAKTVAEELKGRLAAFLSNERV